MPESGVGVACTSNGGQAGTTEGEIGTGLGSQPRASALRHFDFEAPVHLLGHSLDLEHGRQLHAYAVLGGKALALFVDASSVARFRTARQEADARVSCPSASRDPERTCDATQAHTECTRLGSAV